MCSVRASFQFAKSVPGKRSTGFPSLGSQEIKAQIKTPRLYAADLSNTKVESLMNVKVATKLKQNQVQGCIHAETGRDSERIVTPGESQAGHHCDRHNQQAHLQEPGRTFTQDDPLESHIGSGRTLGPDQHEPRRTAPATTAEIQSTREKESQEGIGPDKMPN